MSHHRSTPLACLLLATSLAASLPASAARLLPSAAPIVEMTLIDRDSGRWLPAYDQRGTRWVAGVPGQPYSIRLTNTTDARVLVVLSVDGVNAVTGETADPAQSGYVLAPWQSTEITGWRKSHADVARFEFTHLPDSYAARTGRPDNVGTVGVAVFRERAVPRPSPMPAPPIARGHAPAPASGAARPAAPHAASEAAVGVEQKRDAIQAQRIGTGHGMREWAPVAQTTFLRATRQPAQIVTLRYDAPDALATMGIGPRPPRRSPLPPQAFPGGFVADPPRAGY